MYYIDDTQQKQQVINSNNNQQKTMNSINTIRMYIPRILGTTTTKDVVNTFKYLNIGNVFYIDMHKRVNENQNAYYFAFLIVNLFDTPESKKIENVLAN